MKHLLWIAFFSLSSLVYAQTGAITVKVHSLKSNKGKVMVALYNTEASFPHDDSKIYRKLEATIVNNTAVVVFDKIPYGDYAVMCMHDENNNGEMDFSWGMPTEGYAASNDAKGTFGPKYKDAKFNVAAAQKAISIKMAY